MKIVFVGGISIPSQGGIENYVLNLAKQLRDMGHEIWIICRGDANKDFVLNDIHISQIYCKENALSILVLNIFASLLIFKNSKGINVVNYQSIYLPFLYEWIPKLKKIFVVHTQHSFAQDNPKYSTLQKTFIRILYRISGLVFSPIITVSEYNRKLIKMRFKKNATVINCGVNLPQCQVMSRILESNNINKGRYYLTIGRIDPIKNLHILIKGFMKRTRSDDVQLVICGDMDNSYGEELKSLASMNDRIVFTGVVCGDDKYALLSNCLAYCLVSSSEGFPIALLEAMSYGNVCICSSIPACMEVLPQSMGLWCSPNDEFSISKRMDELETSPERYIDYGKRAQKLIANNLTWSQIANLYITYIQAKVKDSVSVK